MKHRITAALERFSRAMLAPLSYLSAAGLLLVVGALLTSAPLAGVLPFLRWEPGAAGGQDHLQMPHGGHFKSERAVLHRSCGGAGKAGKASGGVHRPDELSCLPDSGQCNADRVGPAGAAGCRLPACTAQARPWCWASRLWIPACSAAFCWACSPPLCMTAPAKKPTAAFWAVCSPVCGGPLPAWRHWRRCWALGPALSGRLSRRPLRPSPGFIAASGNIGLFLYGFLERLLIPTGLHHLVYMPFQFSQLGGQLMVGSVTYTGAYVVMMTEYNLGLPFSDGIVWMYTGFTKTFGYFGIAAAFIFCARRGSRKKTAFQLLPLAFTASLASITEPLDFLFCFSAPVLWLAHAAISGSFIVLLHLCESRRLPRTFWGRL